MWKSGSYHVLSDGTMVEMVFIDEIWGISGSKMDDWSLYTALQVVYVHILERIWLYI